MRSLAVLAAFMLPLIASGRDYVKYVLPEVGTESARELSNGNLVPIISAPFGMNNWAPQTKGNADRWTYQYSDSQITGVRLTRSPSPWIGDYAPICFMPTVGKKRFLENDRKSWFAHKAEKMEANYYKVYLADFDTTLEITPSSRAAIMRAWYPDSEEANFIVDLFEGESAFKVDLKSGVMEGYNTWIRPRGARTAGRLKQYFYIKFYAPIASCAAFDGEKILEGAPSLGGNMRKGAVLTFKTRAGEPVIAKIATSFVSAKQAELNFRREAENFDFDGLRAQGRKLWNEYLGRIDVKDAGLDDLDNVRMFYTALYRILLYPRDFFEIGGDGGKIRFSPFSGKIERGAMTVDNGYWDTFRAVHPLFNLVYPERSALVAEGLANAYKEGGWLPEWSSPGHVRAMIGQNSASIAAAALLQGVENVDKQTLWEGLLKSAGRRHPQIDSVGRWGAEEYIRLGYVPNDIGVRESASRTLEYAYGDFCIMKFAQAAGKDAAVVEKFRSRAQNYKNLYNAQYSLMAGRDSNGNFRKNFNPVEWGGDFTEGNSMHYSWSVFHDIAGLAKLMGGSAAAAKNLDKVFSSPPKFDAGSYKIIIHEIREMQVMNFGQYAHGNQPIQHAAYLYNWFGQPWKSQYWARQIMRRLYKPSPDGYCGDEDNGQTSAWFVFSALGFYPVCPAAGEFAVGSPLFREAEVKMPNGKTLRIIAENNSPENVYIESAKFNGGDFDMNYFSFGQLRGGGEIKFKMSAKPNKKRGAGAEAAPYSMSRPGGD